MPGNAAAGALRVAGMATPERTLAGGEFAVSALVCPMNRYPRRCAVSMYSRRLGVVVHRLAKLPDAGLEHRIADVGRGPDAVEQLLLGHQLARVLDEKPQDGKRLRPQRDPLRAFPQAFIRQVETKSTECDLVGWLHHGNITATARLRYDRPRSCPLFSTRDVRNANAIGTQGGCDVSANSSALANGSAATRSDVRRALGSTCVRAEGCACHGGWHRNSREQWRPAGGVPRRAPVLRGATDGLADGHCRRLRRAPALERQPARLIGGREPRYFENDVALTLTVIRRSLASVLGQLGRRRTAERTGVRSTTFEAQTFKHVGV